MEYHNKDLEYNSSHDDNFTSEYFKTKRTKNQIVENEESLHKTKKRIRGLFVALSGTALIIIGSQSIQNVKEENTINSTDDIQTEVLLESSATQIEETQMEPLSEAVLTADEKTFILAVKSTIEEKNFQKLYNLLNENSVILNQIIGKTDRTNNEYISIEKMSIEKSGSETGMYFKLKSAEKPIIYLGNVIDGKENAMGIKVLFFHRNDKTYINYYEGEWANGKENGIGESLGYPIDQGKSYGTGLRGDFVNGFLQGDGQYYINDVWLDYRVDNGEMVWISDDFERSLGSLISIKEEGEECYIDSYLKDE